MVNVELYKALYKSAKYPRENILCSMLDSIREVMPSKWCSLWRINPIAEIVSLAACSGHNKNGGFFFERVHELHPSLIGDFILPSLKDAPHHYIDIPNIRASNIWKLHRSQGKADKLGLERLVSIAIPSYEQPATDLEGIINIYLEKDFIFDAEKAQLIRDEFSITISRNRLLRRDELVNDIVSLYKDKPGKDLASVLHPLVTRVFKKYMPYQGCSAFIWDPIFNRLALEQTTGLKGNPRKHEVFYKLGSGLTGTVASLKNPIIFPDINKLPGRFQVEHINRWEENLNDKPKSWMAVPIVSPSNNVELIGLLRFVNRLNSFDNKSIDCFTKNDIALISHITNLIGLYIQQANLERLQTAFAKQMAHEMLTPSSSIKGSASRLAAYWNNGMNSGEVSSYLNDIIDQTELQIALTRTVQSVWMSSAILSKRKRYKVIKVDLLEDIIKPAKRIVIPLARERGLHFDSIEIRGTFPTVYVDPHSFQVIFFNLLTNAIKYADMSSPGTFRVIIEGKGVKNVGYTHEIKGIEKHVATKGYLISIRDYGIGINTSETNKVFLLGYRGNNVEEQDVVGLGLGLTAARKILEEFFSYIWIANTKSPTQFNIILHNKLLDNRYISDGDWAMQIQ